ncbi:MAG: PEPxxWA-CTERM sorting domain-containing protein [Parasphingorhabdus sp.]|uniref:PEPxxWA-CTERM sorting domain-containing protein n=1 Tax=Parasphingorhabdus sp. TaxID=2709688 RepID=UPI00329844C5
MKKILLALAATSIFVTPAQALVVVSGSGTLTDSDPTHNPRINRDGVVSTWAAPKTFPGTFGSGDFAYDTINGTFGANAFQDIFYQITYTNDSVNDGQPHSTAYANLFNPLDLSENYLGDSGSSPLLGETLSYQVIVSAGNELLVNFSQNFGGALPSEYSYTIEAFSDANGGEMFAAVPEPTTWAFMIFGFGAIGGALRRNRKTNVKVSYA